MDKIHQLKIEGWQGRILELVVDGTLYFINLSDASKKLATATFDALKEIVPSPSGYGLHWPRLDEDLAVDQLLKNATKRSLNSYIAEEETEYKTK